MNGIQTGDIYHRVSGCREWSLELVKVIHINEKEYVVVACDENGIEDRSAKLQYIQRHVFIDKYEKVRKK